MKLSLIIIFIILFFETSEDSQAEKNEINTLLIIFNKMDYGIFFMM